MKPSITFDRVKNRVDIFSFPKYETQTFQSLEKFTHHVLNNLAGPYVFEGIKTYGPIHRLFRIPPYFILSTETLGCCPSFEILNRIQVEDLEEELLHKHLSKRVPNNSEIKNIKLMIKMALS